jgi:hypothetical protein
MPTAIDDPHALHLENKRLQAAVDARDLTIRDLYRALSTLDARAEEWERLRLQVERGLVWRTSRRLRAVADRLAPAGSARRRLVPRRAAAPMSNGAVPVSPVAQGLRIVIAAPPKAGNTWLKHLLSDAYGLEPVKDYLVPRDGGAWSLRSLVETGLFADGAILHLHAPYSDDLATFADRISARVVTIVRDPYDLFVSAYHHVQRVPFEVAAALGRGRLHGRPIDHPEVLAYLDEDYGDVLAIGAGWIDSGRSLVVRYENLLAAPHAELERLTDQIRPLTAAIVARAVERCQADEMRRNPALTAHVRVARAGDWQNHLTAPHLDIFRRRHADVIERLGYAVR